MPTTQQITDWKGQKLVGNDDEKLGTIDDIYLDEQTGQPEWLAVKTGLFGTKMSFVPLADAQPHDDHIHVPYTKDQIKDAPHVEADGALSQQEEAELYRHYDRSYADVPTGNGDTVGHDTSGPTTDDAMTRSEEELKVGTTQRESGRVRLRKYVVTEEQNVTVPVSHEEVRIEREPITDANRNEALDGPAISEEEHEVVLHTEEPVVQKQVVPKERVRMDTETVAGEETVSEEVRKERIDVEGGTAS